MTGYIISPSSSSLPLETGNKVSRVVNDAETSLLSHSTSRGIFSKTNGRNITNDCDLSQCVAVLIKF